MALDDAGRLGADTANDSWFIQMLSSAFARSTPIKKLDSVDFTFADRVAAWFSGFGTDLRLLKEMHLDDPLDEQGRVVPKSTFTAIKRTSLIMVGAEEVAVKRPIGAIENELRGLPPGELVRTMSDMMLRSHFEAVAYDRLTSQSKASPREIKRLFASFHAEYELSLFERLYLWLFADGFTEEEKSILLGRTPPAAPQQPAAPAARGGRLSVSDLTTRTLAAPTRGVASNAGAAGTPSAPSEGSEHIGRPNSPLRSSRI